MIGEAVSIAADIDLPDAVVNTDRDRVTPREHEIRDIVLVGDGEAVPHAGRRAVNPDPGFPVSTFQRQDDPAAGPPGRDIDIPLVPRCALVHGGGSQPEGELDVARFSVPSVPLFGEPGPVNDPPDPFRVNGDRFPSSVLSHRPGEMNGVLKSLQEPSLADTGIARIHAEVPHPRKVPDREPGLR